MATHADHDSYVGKEVKYVQGTGFAKATVVSVAYGKAVLSNGKTKRIADLIKVGK